MRLLILSAIVTLFSLQTPLQQQRTTSIEGGNVPTADGIGGITEIILERTWCYGACPIDTLVLHSDGTALYTGNANTELSGQFAGVFPKEDFEQLAKWLVSEGFLKLKSSYGSPNVDTSTQVIRVTVRGEQKSVVNNSINASEMLWVMERVIRGAAADIRWLPVKSGIRGVATWKPTGEAWRPLPNTIILINLIGEKKEFSIKTDPEGRYEIALIPGTYRIEPLIFGRSPQLGTPPRVNPEQTVSVLQERFIDGSFQHDRATGKTLMAGDIPARGNDPARK